MGLVQNLKKTLNALVDKILVELSCYYLAKQTLEKQDNSSSMESSPSPLTTESLPTTIATSSAGTSEKTTMKRMETEDIVAHVRDWAIDTIQSYNSEDISRIYDQMALMDEFHEWLVLKDDLEIVSVDQISDEEYEDYLESQTQ
jgi:hypothetical protein